LKKIVMSLGGSVMVPGNDDVGYLAGLADLVLSRRDEARFVIVTGGGRTARDYIDMGRRLGMDEASLDGLGISVTRVNARLLIGALKGYSYPVPFGTLEEGLLSVRTHGLTVGGGTHPGHTTDTVSALIAEMWGADLFVNLTAVPGAFTSDPKKNPDARRLDRLTTEELLELVSRTDKKAGSHSVMDPLAAQIIHRAGIDTAILDGRDLDALGRCLSGEPFDGTVVTTKGEGT